MKQRDMMPPTKTWKNKERDLANLFGAVRRPLSGGNSSQGTRRDDANHPRLFLESKYSIRHAVATLWRFAKACCQREMRHPKRRPVVGLYEKGDPRCLLVINEDDLLFVALELIKALIKDHSDPSYVTKLFVAAKALEAITD
jgi:hypothetical protein